MLERGLLPDFSAAVVAETGSIANAAAASDSSLRDLRRLLWASIDNDDSLDLDQLSVAEQLPGGVVKIFVAVADVDAIVKKGSAIDGHASTNTTSVYTAAEIFPMLPEKLSTDLTSLADGKERLAIVIEIEVGADGAVGKSDIYRAVVVNRAKLAYNGVATGSALARALGANRRAGKGLGRAFAAKPQLPGTAGVPREAPAGRSRELSRTVAFSRQAVGPR
jgi:exoribonuclease-2